MSAFERYEAFCDHCHQGVLSRDSLIMTGHERLCVRCCHAREEMEARIRRVSGWLLMICSFAGGLLGNQVAPLVGLFPGVIAGLMVAASIEAVLRHY